MPDSPGAEGVLPQRQALHAAGQGLAARSGGRLRPGGPLPAVAGVHRLRVRGRTPGKPARRGRSPAPMRRKAAAGLVTALSGQSVGARGSRRRSRGSRRRPPPFRPLLGRREGLGTAGGCVRENGGREALSALSGSNRAHSVLVEQAPSSRVERHGQDPTSSSSPSVSNRASARSQTSAVLSRACVVLGHVLQHQAARRARKSRRRSAAGRRPGARGWESVRTGRSSARRTGPGSRPRSG